MSRPSTALSATLLLGAVFAACASAPPVPAAGPPPASSPIAIHDGTPPAGPPPSPLIAQVQPAGSAASAASAASTASTGGGASAASPASAESSDSEHCPDGMVFIEGDYCTKVKHTCSVEWWAPQNRKRVCEQFEEKTRCVGSHVKKRYCIDKFSWPNKKGAHPEVMNHFYQAQVKCAAAGKRMCSESEWNFACEGPDAKPFPYGYTRDPKKCNGDHRWDNPSMKKVARRDPAELARLWRGVPSGSQPECVSDFGVHDMPANNDEVVAGETHRTKFSSVHTGGPWYSGVRNQCRPKVYTHREDFYYYFLGFRCCSNADGEANEPLTPKQRKAGWTFKRVEGLARFTVEQMKKVLAIKERGKCDCVNNRLEGVKLHRSPRYLCKTMCGTLVGPGAKDGNDETRVPHRSRRKLH